MKNPKIDYSEYERLIPKVVAENIKSVVGQRYKPHMFYLWWENREAIKEFLAKHDRLFEDIRELRRHLPYEVFKFLPLYYDGHKSTYYYYIEPLREWWYWIEIFEEIKRDYEEVGYEAE